MTAKAKKGIMLMFLAFLLVILAAGGYILNRKINQPESDEEAIRQEFARIRAPAKEWLEKYSQKDEILYIEIQGNWATLEFGGSDLITGDPIPAGPGFMVFRKVMGIWIGGNWGTPLFRLIVRTAPESVFSAEDKEFFLP